MAQQNNFPVQVKSPPAAGTLKFERMTCTERLSDPFCFDVSVSSERADVNGAQLLGMPVTVSLLLPTGDIRLFNGLVTRLVRTGEQVLGPTQAQRQMYRYQLRLQPWLSLLSRSADCRIFQNQTVSQIFEAVAKDHGFSDYELKLSGNYQALEYCVQYRETALNFVSRLLEAAGIFYFFQHQDGKHIMVLSDHGGAFQPSANYGTMKYAQTGSGRTTSDTIESWSVEHSVEPGSYATTDFDFEKPDFSLLQSASQPGPHAQSGFEVFDYPAQPDVIDAAGVEQVADVRLEETRCGYERYRGASADCGGLRAGSKFKLTGHPQSAFNTPEYVIVGTEQEIISNQYASGGGPGPTLRVTLEAIDAETEFRPARTARRPIIQGNQSATVVGPAGEEIYTDQYGRVKVQFPWDRYGHKDENSSCWMRVAQLWAGKNWGAIHIPRVGQEVLVSFLEGDPARPIITGRVYNGAAMPPYALPANMTQSGIISRSTKSGAAENFNEIRFEDKKGGELVNVQAEKDFTSLVKNDETTEVKHDRTDKVGHDETVTIQNDQSTTINGQETRKVAKDRTTNVDGTETLKVGKDQKINVGATFELVAADKITLRTGQSSLVMQSDGTIELHGVSITVTGDQTVTVKGNVGATVQVSSTSVKLDPAQLKIAATMIGINGSAQTQVQGAIVQVSASGIAQVSGGLIMIG